MIKKTLVIAFLVSLLITSFVFADTISKNTTTTVTTTVEKGFIKSNEPYVEPLYGMVVKLENGEVVTNLGETKNIKPGTTFYVYRVKTFIGVVKVYDVGNWTSVAKIVSVEKGQSINRGDRLSEKELIFVDDMVYVKNTVTTSTSANSNNNSNVKLEIKDTKPSDSSSVSSPSYKDIKVTNLEDIIKKHTRFASFKKKGKATRTIETPQINVPGVPSLDMPVPAYSSHGFLYNPYGFNLMDALQIGSWASIFTNNNYNNAIYGNNWPLYSSIGFTVYTRVYNIQQYEKIKGMLSNADIMVTKWDESMAYELASFYAYKNAINDQGRINQMAEAIIKEKKIKEYLVFEVKIRSTETGMVQFAPWNYHMYLVDAKGSRVKTDKYDASLDKGLTRGQEMSGFVYFDKSYDSGKIKVSLEDMMGANNVMTF